MYHVADAAAPPPPHGAKPRGQRTQGAHQKAARAGIEAMHIYQCIILNMSAQYVVLAIVFVLSVTSLATVH